ncbi:MAG: sugar phosphate isomerase/epimerase [Actinobacteria bacterium]|nr:sugar phosphate isomerase/epimerase [Actinomycetota bacterium]
MKITEENLVHIEDKYKCYMKGEKVDEFFAEFDIKFAAGHWCAGGFSDRFAPAYQNKSFDSGILAQIKRVAEAGIKGIEFHDSVFLDDNHRPIDSLIIATRDALNSYMIYPTNLNINLWTDFKWRLGGLANPKASIRIDALEIAYQAIDIANQLGCKSVTLWPGSDGWDYSFQVNYGELLNHFIQGCIEINKRATNSGLIFAVEPKLKEPREGNMILSTSAKAFLVVSHVNKICGGVNMGVCIDYGHEQMCGVEPADMLYTAKAFNIPVVNFHLNNAKHRSNDEDLCAGTGDVWRLTDFCYAAIDTNYQGWFVEDQYTYRMEPVIAMALSKEMFANGLKKALLIYANREELQKAQGTGLAENTIRVVNEILIG